ncbi:MAG: hypothetical protein IJ599_04395 [Alphaproteobacteria bacterium]|nr:hypothetical protein [Alphaproteobacteria bacterium]
MFSFSDVSSVIIAVFVSGSLAVIALLLSVLLRRGLREKGTPADVGAYECGFCPSEENIRYVSEKARLIPLYLITEIVCLWLLTYVVCFCVP